MRAAILGAVIAGALPMAAAARSTYAPVQVTLAVDDACRVQTPPRFDLKGFSAMGALTLVPGCRTGVAPLFTFENDFVEGGYVATINF